MCPETQAIIVPHPRQWDVLRCPADEILYGGAAGAGKSFCIILDWSKHEQQHGGKAYGLILRRTNPQLEQILRDAKFVFSQLPNPPKWVENKRHFEYPSGATLRFGFLDGYDDVFNYIGHAYTWIAHDELTLWGDDSAYTLLGTRLRSAHGVSCRRLNTTNPGGPGHGWVMDRYQIDKYPHGMVPIYEYIDISSGLVSPQPGWNELKDWELPEGIHRRVRIFIPGRLSDNPNLDHDGKYRADLMTKDERTRKMLLEGRWDVVEGAFFTEWDPSVHVVPWFKPPADWRRWMACDYGTHKPHCELWCCESPNGDEFVYREFYGWGGKPNKGTNERATEIAKKILDVEHMADEYITERWLDYESFADRGADGSIGKAFQLAGVNFEPSAKADKKGAIENLRDHIKIVNGKSRLKIMDNCTHLIRTMPIQQVDKNNPDIYDTDLEDHAVDTLVYLLRRQRTGLKNDMRGKSLEGLNSRRLAPYSGYGVW